MARDKITVDLTLATKQAEREIAKINRKLADLGKVAGKAFGGTGGGGDKVRALGTGLSKATVKADEFNKSLEASNARVIAFGASAGLIMQVDRAMKAMVQSAVKVEKAMMDVNIVMDLTHRQLQEFGKGMFKVAKETAQSFETVAEASTELARQGLGMEKTLVRTKDALILTRLTGMSAADSVKSLTAAVNSFNKEGVTSAQVINRMAKVDQKFAVSSDDLAKAVSRVGASAISAGVNLNELMAITTAVQQKTARGGAVIGNAFKTIFTRLQRSDVKNQLRNFGVAVTDMNGQMLSGIQVLQNLANEFDNLSKSQQSSITEQVAGVFQVNILKSALSDLSSETSNYRGALKAANSATDEAYQKNEKLNTTLDALLNKTLANLTQAGAGLGGATLAPAIEKILNGVNAAIDAFGEGGRFESFGQGMGKDILKGIGNVISGPGLVIIGAVVTKLALSLGKYTAKAFGDIMGINEATKQRIALEQAVIAHISSEPALLAKVNAGSAGILSTERSILATIQAQTLERAKMAAVSAPIAAALYGRGARVGSTGTVMRGRGPRLDPPGGASGFIPNFANAGSERMAAAAGGYRAGAIKTMQQPGEGTMMYNSAETVKRFPGMLQSAIMPPQGSPAGAGYKSAFGASHGFDPYAGSGFVPNFAGLKGGKPSKPLTVKYPKDRAVGVVLGSGPREAVGQTYSQPVFGSSGVKKVAAQLPKQAAAWAAEYIPNPKLEMRNISTRGLFPLQSKSLESLGEDDAFDDEFDKFLDEGLGEFGARIRKEIFPKSSGKKVSGISKFLGSDVRGNVFEASLRGALHQSPKLVEGAGKHANFDFNPNKEPDKQLLRLFGMKELKRIEAKIKAEAAGNIVSKFANEFGLSDFKGAIHNIKYTRPEFSTREYEAAMAAKARKGKGRRKASGFIPNFSPLTDAVGRELSAGVPASAIRIGSSSALKSSGNSAGLGVYNTRDEPGGLGQGISRSRSQGMNPKVHGYSKGFVPNFEESEFFKNLNEKIAEGGKGGVDATNKNTKAIDKLTKKFTPGKAMTAGVAVTMFAPTIVEQLPIGQKAKDVTIAGAQGAGTGAAAGALGMSALSGGLGAVGMGAMGASVAAAALPVTIFAALVWGGYQAYKAYNKEAEPAVQEMEKQVEVIKSLSQVAMEAAEGIKALNKELSNAAFLSLKEAEIKKMTETTGVDMSGTKEDKAVRAAVNAKQLSGALENFSIRAAQREAIQGMTRKGALGSGTFAPGFMERERKSRAEGVAPIQDRYSAETAKLKKELGAMTIIRQQKLFGTKKPKEFQLEKEVARREAEDLLRRARYKSFATMPGSPGKAMARSVTRGLGEGGGGQFGLSAYYRRLAEKGEGIGLGAIPPAGAAEKLGAISGLPASDFKAMVDEMREEMSPEQFGNFNNVLVSLMTDVGLYNKAVKEGVEQEEAKKRLASETVAKNLELITSVRNLSTTLLAAGKEADLNFKIAQNQSKHQLALLKISQQDEKVGKEMLVTKRKLIDLDHKQATTSATRIKQEAGVVATARRARDITKSGIKAGSEASKELIKLFAEEKVTPEGAKPMKEALESTQKMITDLMAEFAATTDPEEFAKLLAKKIEEQNTLLAQQAAGFPGMGDQKKRKAVSKLVAYDATLTDVRLAEADRRATVKLAAKTETDAHTLARRNLNLAIERYRNDVKINEGQREVLRTQKALKDLLIVGETDRRFEAGRVSGATRSKTRQSGLAALAQTDMTNQEILDQWGLEAWFQATKTDRTPGGMLKERKKGARAAYEERITGSARNAIDEFDDFAAGLNAAAAEVVSFSQVVRTAVTRAQAEADYKAGRTTSGSLRQARAADRLSRRRSGQARSGDMMEAFRDQFLYNDQDAMDDFEEGVIGVADTMKTSFSEAFKSITSGASSAKEAFAGMAVSILDSISNMTSQIATNMLFNQMNSYFGAQGGLVPRYNQGGVVTGGSGHKDDVLSMMSGGEFVIKKSSAQKIGYGALDAINSGGTRGYAGGGPTGKKEGPGMGTMFAVSAGASAISGLISQQNNRSKEDPWRGQDYGFGRGEHGYFGGSEYDAGGVSSVGGGGRSAQVSLDKRFAYYRRDPQTGRLISERARPTEGRYEVSSALSLRGRLNEDDPRTSRMFGKEGAMGSYQDYLYTETKRREEVIKAHEKMKKGRLISAYANAAMLIGGSYLFGNTQVPEVGGKRDVDPNTGYIRGSTRFERGWASGGAVGGGSPAMLTGGEYVMSPQTVRTHGANFMQELNRGNVPGMAGGGFVGNQSGAGGMLSSGATNNNVSINVNVDNSGNARSETSVESSDNVSKEGSVKEAEKNKQLGVALKTVVLQEIMKQQRPGGLLQSTLKFGKG